MRYVTLKGGPFDGKKEGVVDTCHRVRKLHEKGPLITAHTYVESQDNPEIFNHEVPKAP